MWSFEALPKGGAVDLSCLVCRQSQSCVFRSSTWTRSQRLSTKNTDVTCRDEDLYDGPVALKAIASCAETTTITTPKADRDAVEEGQGTWHPLLYEAFVHAYLSRAARTRRCGVPAFVDCVAVAGDAAERLNRLLSSSTAPSALAYPVLVTQFIKAAPVSRLFYTFPTLPFSVVISIIVQLTHLLAVLQKDMGVVYGDLKLTNVLIAQDRGRVWLVDFASSVVCCPTSSHRNSSSGDEEVSLAARHIVASTTPHLLCPELRVLRHGLESMSSRTSTTASSTYACHHEIALQDVWALGVFCVEVLCGRLFHGEALVTAVVNACLAETDDQRRVHSHPANEKENGQDAHRLQTAMADIRAWVRASLNDEARARYARCVSSADDASPLASGDEALWNAMVKWIGKLLEPDPRHRFAMPRGEETASSETEHVGRSAALSHQRPAAWDAILDHEFFHIIQARAPSLMRFARQAGQPVSSAVAEVSSSDADEDCWWWPEALEEEVGDLMLGL